MNSQNTYQAANTISQDIQDICKPLFDQTLITKFCYGRLDSKGGQIVLSTHAEWLAYYFQNNHHLLKVVKETPSFLTNQFVLWSFFPENILIKEAREFDIHSGISIIRKNASYLEIFNFGSRNNSGITANSYINNLDILSKFELYFKEKASRIISSLSPDISISSVDWLTPLLISEPTCSPERTINAILDPANVTVDYQNKKVILTRAELHCVVLMMQGYTAKEIAKKLCLSSRTIEFYLQKVRKKFNCHCKSELINILQVLQKYFKFSSKN